MSSSLTSAILAVQFEGCRVRADEFCRGGGGNRAEAADECAVSQRACGNFPGESATSEIARGGVTNIRAGGAERTNSSQHLFVRPHGDVPRGARHNGRNEGPRRSLLGRSDSALAGELRHRWGSREDGEAKQLAWGFLGSAKTPQISCRDSPSPLFGRLVSSKCARLV